METTAPKPMLADSGDGALPSGDGWTYEIKWDGYRCVATIRGGKAYLTSRSGKPLWFNKIAKGLEGLPDCVIDGEAVVMDERGISHFGSITQNSPDAQFVAFDLISEGHRPIEERRELLAMVMDLADKSVAGVGPVFDDGEALLSWAEEHGVEGVVAKRAGSRYSPGRRCDDWVKVKIRLEQEFAVAGWTPQEKYDGVLGSLVLVVRENGEWVYCGKVGTGWNRRTAEKLLAKVRESKPGERISGPKDKDVRWVEPTVVVQVAFQRWTDDGCLWHPSYQGLRIDKDAVEVTRD